MFTPNSALNTLEDKIYPTGTGTWSGLPATWAAWTNWYEGTPNELYWLSDKIDLFVPTTFTLNLNIVANGIVSYEVYTSNTGAFAGEESTQVIDSGDTDVPGFYGRYVQIGVKVIRSFTEVQTISAIDIVTSDASITEEFENVSTSTLAGTITARQIPITKKFSILNVVDVAVQQVSAYNLDVYVTDYLSCTTLLPRVVSKNRTTPTIALIGLDNVPRNGTVDITVTGLPEQYMSGNNLLTR